MEVKKIIDGKKIAQKIYTELKIELENIYKSTGKRPKFEIILANESQASSLYVNRKIKIANEIGIEVKLHKISRDVSSLELESLILKINEDQSTHALILQLPLPTQIDAKHVCNLINFAKDVDGLSALNAGFLNLGFSKDTRFFNTPCTPLGCMILLDEYKIDVRGKKCLIINRSNIVGKPLSAMLLQRGAFVQIAHSEAGDFSREMLEADLIFSGVGKKSFIKKEMIKDGAILFDIGISFDENEKLCGDVDLGCFEKAKFITPVPGGVGQMTVAALMKNIVDSFKYLLSI